MDDTAIIGDIHGCIDELATLHGLLFNMVGKIYHTGDLVDRGPDSAAVVEFCRINGVFGPKGNHDSVIVKHRHSNLRNQEKLRTIASIKSEEDWDYLESLPLLHVIDRHDLVLVHGGLVPGLELWQQPYTAGFLQLYHPSFSSETRWWGKDDKHGRSEAENTKQGWRRWYLDHGNRYDVVYGHSVYPKPFRYGRTIGVDTGCVFGNCLSAVLYPSKTFVSVRAKRVYFDRTRQP